MHGTVLIEGDRLRCLRGRLIIVDPFDGQQGLFHIDCLDRILAREDPPELHGLLFVLAREGSVP